jgi:hypothetical protein
MRQRSHRFARALIAATLLTTAAAPSYAADDPQRCVVLRDLSRNKDAEVYDWYCDGTNVATYIEVPTSRTVSAIFNAGDFRAGASTIRPVAQSYQLPDSDAHLWVFSQGATGQYWYPNGPWVFQQERPDAPSD